MKLERLKKLNCYQLIAVGFFFILPIYIAAEGTTSHDSNYLVLLNFLVLLILTLLSIGIWCLPPLIMLGIYKLKDLTAEDIPDKLLYLFCFIGLFLCLYAGNFFSHFYETFQATAVEIVYGR